MNNNLFLTAFPLATIMAVLGVVVALAYQFTCKAVERHIASAIPDSDKDEAGTWQWYRKRCALDRTRIGIAVCSGASFAVGVYSLALAHSPLAATGAATHARGILTVVLLVSLWIVGGLSLLHYGRLSDLQAARCHPGFAPQHKHASRKIDQ